MASATLTLRYGRGVHSISAWHLPHYPLDMEEGFILIQHMASATLTLRYGIHSISAWHLPRLPLDMEDIGCLCSTVPYLAEVGTCLYGTLSLFALCFCTLFGFITRYYTTGAIADFIFHPE